jgi:hypothetical protein
MFDAAGYASLAPGWPDDPATVTEANGSPQVFAGKSVGDVAEHLQGVIGGLTRTYEQFRYSFANAVSEEEAKELYETFAVPAPAKPLFQAASANLNPWTEVKVDTGNPARGPLLIISGEKDHTVPRSIANASFKRQQRNEGVTEFVEMPGRGHALTIDSGWRGVAATAVLGVYRQRSDAARSSGIAMTAITEEKMANEPTTSAGRLSSRSVPLRNRTTSSRTVSSDRNSPAMATTPRTTATPRPIATGKTTRGSASRKDKRAA